VAYLVEGSVRRAGDDLRITAQLIDTSTGYHVWSERFDRGAGDVFEIQDEIASAVAERLAEHVGRSGSSPRPVARSTELSAYDEYLKGRQAMAGFAGGAVVEAAAHFEESIARDPGFAAAHAGLAEALTLQSIGFQARPEKETMPRARQEADLALELDPGLPEAHLARALVAMYYEWDYGAAREAFDQAVRLGPNVARVHMWREFFFTYVEHDYDAAIAANKRAQDLNPLDPGPRSREATVRYLFGHLAEAEALLRAMLAETPDLSILHVGLGDTLMRHGRIDEAVTSMERAVELGGPMVAFLGIMGAFYGLQGSVEKSRDILRQLEARSEQGYVSSFWIAVVQAGLGDLDAAFSSLETARTDRDSNLLYTFFLPRAMGFQNDPRFPEVLRSIGLSHLIPLL
jgi:tetratricopeptide (TPR) repeat protein